MQSSSISFCKIISKNLRRLNWGPASSVLPQRRNTIPFRKRFSQIITLVSQQQFLHTFFRSHSTVDFSHHSHLVSLEHSTMYVTKSFLFLCCYRIYTSQFYNILRKNFISFRWILVLDTWLCRLQFGAHSIHTSHTTQCVKMARNLLQISIFERNPNVLI